MSNQKIWCSLQQDGVKTLLSLLSSSRHQKFVSLVKPFFEPLLKEVAEISLNEGTHSLIYEFHSLFFSLYFDHVVFSDLTYRISCAWLRLGGLRFQLLLACDDLDPAIKYWSKYQKLVDKCKSLGLENEVSFSVHFDYFLSASLFFTLLFFYYMIHSSIQPMMSKLGQVETVSGQPFQNHTNCNVVWKHGAPLFLPAVLTVSESD